MNFGRALQSVHTIIGTSGVPPLQQVASAGQTACMEPGLNCKTRCAQRAATWACRTKPSQAGLPFNEELRHSISLEPFVKDHGHGRAIVPDDVCMLLCNLKIQARLQVSQGGHGGQAM